MSTSLGRIASGTVWMANLSVEEPDALVCARPGLWEPWVGNDPGPPGQQHYQRRNRQARVSHTKTRIKRLAALGIAVTQIKSCLPDTTEP